MSAFDSTSVSGIALWRGTPTCQAAHDSLLATLLGRHAPLPPINGPLSNRRRGNLGEFIAFCVGRDCAYCPPEFHVVAANAFNPLQDISVSNVDILWFSFGATPAEDRVVVHEMKTTTESSLAYADELVTDYSKLFGPSVATTLHARLQVLSQYVEFTMNRPELTPRLATLAGDSPTRSTQVVLAPTVVHDRAHDPVPRLIAIRTEISALGWSGSQISPWSIALDQLDDRLLRLAKGQA
jgi:hypothetical protein